MDILDSALGTDIKKIIGGDPTETNFFWDCDIHCTEDKTVHVIKVLSIDTMSDYVNNFTDEIILQVVIPAGAYTYHVYPNMSVLEVTLYKTPVNEVGGGTDDSRTTESERYVATIINPRNPTIASNSFNQPDEFALDLTNLFTIDLQLVPKSVDQFRTRAFGGTYRNTSVEEVIKAVLTNESKIVKTDGTAVPTGVNMISANNKTKRDHIVLPQGTRLVDVPGYIHTRCGGVYNAGFAYYFLNNTWYVFPPYNNVDFSKYDKTLTLIRVPPNRMPGSERSYMVNGMAITAIVTGDTKMVNKSETLMRNEGNGTRLGDADKFMEDFVATKDNKAIAGRGGSNSEFTTIKRPDGFNNVPLSRDRISSNPFVEMSRLAFKDGAMMSMSWENSDPTLLYPGMPVKVLFMEDDQIRETQGLLVQAHHYVQTLGTGFQTNRHIVTSNLMIFTKRVIDVNDDGSVNAES